MGEREPVSLSIISERLKLEGIEAILFDADDCLWDMHSIFRACRNRALAYFFLLFPETDQPAFKEKFETINNEVFKTHKVNPNRWHELLVRLRDDYPEISGLVFLRFLEKIMATYTIPPKVYDDVFPTLQILKETGLFLGMVTHGNERWQNWKIDVTAIGQYFPPNKVRIISQDSFKSAEEWLAAIRGFGFRPEEVIVVEDNVEWGINAVHKAGVSSSHLFWVDRGFGWRLYRTGELPKGAITINSISGLIEYMLLSPPAKAV